MPLKKDIGGTIKRSPESHAWFVEVAGFWLTIGTTLIGYWLNGFWATMAFCPDDALGDAVLEIEDVSEMQPNSSAQTCVAKAAPIN